jgi:hypothetical protein
MASQTFTSPLMGATTRVRRRTARVSAVRLLALTVAARRLYRVPSDENIFPVWDFHELAGMTAELETPLLSCDGKGGSDYDRWPKVMNYTKEVGGVSDGISGAAAMNLSSGTLHHVLNFWAFADDFYLHLGASPADSRKGNDSMM